MKDENFEFFEDFLDNDFESIENYFLISYQEDNTQETETIYTSINDYFNSSITTIQDSNEYFYEALPTWITFDSENL